MDEARFVTIDNTLSKLVKDVLPKFVARIKAVEVSVADVKSGSTKLEDAHTAYRLDNDSRIASLEATVSKLEELASLVAEYEGRIARLEGQTEAVLGAIQRINEKLDAAPVMPEKPKRKRRTKAEMEAARAAEEQAAVCESETPQPIDPTEPEVGCGLIPETVSGIDITKSVIKAVLQDVKSHSGDWDAVAEGSQYPADVVRYIQNMPTDVIKETVVRFPD